WSQTDLKHWDEAVQGVIRHLADARDLWMLRAQALDQSPRSLVHVAIGAVDVTAHDVEKIRVDAVPRYHVGDPAFQMLAPCVGAEVHVREPSVTVTVVVPVDPVQVVDVAVDLPCDRAGNRRPAG